MWKRHVFAGSPIAVVLMLIVGGFVFALTASIPHADANADSGLMASTQPLGGHSVHNPPGVPAISPRSLAVSASMPTFTASDADQYVNSTTVFRAVTSRQPTIVVTRFMTVVQLDKLLGAIDLGLPETAPVCYVELHGSFTFAGPKGSTKTYSRAIEVFDGHTGNFLMSGGLT